MIKKSLVSLVVRTYQAEKFIKAAINGAFNQTYSPLEIIFSDDASTDTTFEIIEKAVANYKGNHSIVVNRNDKQSGIGSHFNKIAFEIAKGDWIVIADGDDISLPNRVERLMDFADENIAAIHHNNFVIDENSTLIDYEENFENALTTLSKNNIEKTIKKGVRLRGATMCLNKKMIQLFGKLNDDIVHEDIVFAYRAQSFGKIVYINEKLIEYREHINSVSYNHDTQVFENYKKIKNRNANKLVSIYHQILNDNKVLKLSSSFLLELKNKNNLHKIDLLFFSNGAFELSFLLKSFFYEEAFKWIILKPYFFLKYYFKKDKKN